MRHSHTEKYSIFYSRKRDENSRFLRRRVCGQHRIRLDAERPPMLLGRDTRHPFYGRKESK